MLAAGGYGISQITVCEKSPVLNKELAKAGLRTNDISILVIDRGDEEIAIPNAQLLNKVIHITRKP